MMRCPPLVWCGPMSYAPWLARMNLRKDERFSELDYAAAASLRASMAVQPRSTTWCTDTRPRPS